MTFKMSSSSNDNQPEVLSTRSEIMNNVRRSVIAITAAVSVLPTLQAANARQGAFEMDLEYYLKTVASRAQGKPDATINAKTAKPAFASARVINKDLASDVVTVVYQQIGRLANLPSSSIKTKVDAQMVLFLPYFKEFVPIRKEDYSDQYYFDITLYVSYLIAAILIPKSTDRVILRKAVGDDILGLLISKKLVASSLDVKSKLIDSTTSAVISAEKMTLFARGVKEIVSAFKKANFITDFKMDEEDIADKIFAESSFVEGLPVSFQVSLVSPVTILGFIETAAADTFFHPEIMATTLTSWGRSLGYKAHYEDYLVDNLYMANGIDTNIVTAQDALIEMQIATQNSDSPDF
eukprot:CAMPEP_0119046522 /NCGR_PEP_ID=MMETSP1177-20130426/47189_1 /TAXON_ID=2985 /ORGANISM="Ochromonas sp, Strain CCMP1899" /LENGTH=350 /DNA_ID=CAMNT_0007019793 /DNA_START=116 /DNA_END=1168 /DNA_ORIENTATION=+